MTACTHKVLPLSAPIAQHCGACGRLRPLEPARWTGGGELYLDEEGIVAR